MTHNQLPHNSTQSTPHDPNLVTPHEVNSKVSSGELDRLRGIFMSLGLRYSFDTFRYCAERDIILDDLRQFTPKNHLDLVLLGTSSKSPTDAEKVIQEFIEKSGSSLPILHLLCLEELKESGFFTREDDLKILQGVVESNPDLVTLVAPSISREYQDVLTFMIQQAYYNQLQSNQANQADQTS